MSWLTAMPIALVRACAAMLLRLEAEEALQTVTRVAVGVGRLSDEELRRLTAVWARAAGQVESAPTAADFRQRVATMGIGVTVLDPGASAAHV